MRKILFFLFLVLLFVWAGWTGYEAYKIRPLNGNLQSDVDSISHTLNGFLIDWSSENGGALSITQSDHPDKVLWQSLPGKSFVMAGIGQESVEEARGSFFVEDMRLVNCTHQSVDSLALDGSTVTLSGTLECSGDDRTPAYVLSFSPVSENQLAFELKVSEPDFNRIYLTYASNADEQFMGFGEQFSFFNLKGRRLPIFVMEQGIGRGAQPITAGADIQARSGGDWHTSYAGVPHYITSQMRSLFLSNTEYSVFDLRRGDRVQISLFSSAMSGRILAGDTPAALIEEYTAYAGRMRALPPWILNGAVVGMQGGTEKVRSVWEQLKERDTPIAAFWLQDWVGQRTTSFGKQLWWNWELDAERYPGWDALVSDFDDAGIRMMIYTSPFLADVSEKPNVNRNLFNEAAESGYLIRQADGSPYLIQNTSFSAGLLDLTNPEAVEWMKTVIRENLIGSGASGWMADFGEALPYDSKLAGDITAAEFHNQYPVAWAQLNREAIEEAGLGDEIVFFSRSGFTRSPAYTTLFWEGDQLVSWDRHDGIKTALIGLMSSGISGFAFNHSDIGGYTTITNPIATYHRSEELLLRWMEMNAFSVVYRTHEGNQPDNNVQFYTNDTTLDHFDQFARVYAAWSFYRDQLVREASETGMPVVRHLFIHYYDDPQVLKLEHQFMVGSELLVAPVLDPETDEVRVYLPAGRWVHVWSGELFGDASSGSWVNVAAPLGEPPVFYPEGSTVGAEFVKNLAELGVTE